MSHISTIEQLTSLYAKVHPLADAKVINELEPHSMTFIENCPFILISTVDKKGFIDTSPRGGKPGFVRILDSKTIVLPDSPGNNRLDTLRNIIERPEVGILLTIPGIEDIVRIKGTASIHNDQNLLNMCLDGGRKPKLVIKVIIEENFFHCPKAIMLAKLWHEDSKINRDFLPSLLQIIKDQQSYFN